MDYLQYIKNGGEKKVTMSSVLNLVINGLPSIPIIVNLSLSLTPSKF